jgi:hypothetical protein
MESIKTAMFDNPLPIFIGLAILELIFMVAFASRRTLRRGLLLATPTVLAVIVCLTSWLVPTDRKAILAASSAICSDIQAGKKDALEANLDVKFSGIYAGMPLDKPGAIRAAKLLKEGLQITRMLLVPSASKIEVHNGRAWMTAVILMTGTSEILGTGNGRATIDLVWIKGPDGVWRILQSTEPQ